MNRSQCFHWVEKFLPLMEKALGWHKVLPKSQIRSMEELLTFCPDIKDLFIDATERRTQRPAKPKLQRKCYSGKKKSHTRKNTILANEGRKVLFVSPTREGRVHDLTQLKKTGLLRYLPPGITLWLDKGYQGIQKVLRSENAIMMPHKKPKGKSLTSEQKQENKVISGLRIVVEHALNGIKRFRAMSDLYRNRKGQDDQMIYISAALWNFHLQYSSCQ